MEGGLGGRLGKFHQGRWRRVLPETEFHQNVHVVFFKNKSGTNERDVAANDLGYFIPTATVGISTMMEDLKLT